MFNKSSEWAYRFVSPIIALTAKTQTRLRNMRTKYTTCSNKQLRCISIITFFIPHRTTLSQVTSISATTAKKTKKEDEGKKTKRRGQKMITFHLKSLAKKCLKFWHDAYAATLIVLHLSFFLHFGLEKLSFQHQSSCVQNFVIMINVWWRRGKLWWTFPFVILCDSLCLFYPFLNFVRNA